ncbi:hypothetical protein FBALC1_15647 [Flavobacteriales bacterium ALC-1]|nr:hypothetical protein FBALC1_15647 [Flavobacteriales bacterium ALC-1]
MKTPLIITVLVLSALLQCKGQEEKVLENTTECESLITEQLTLFWKQLASFQSTYFIDESEQDYRWNYDFKNSKISIFKNGSPYLSIDFIHVGKINVSEKTWTWSWINIQETETSKLQEVKMFGETNNCEKLNKASWLSAEKEAWEMVAMTNYILKTKGGARHYTKAEYNYVVFTKIQEITD